MKQQKFKIRKGDTVKVLSGKDKGKTGKVLSVLPKLGRAVVEGVNIHTRFERGRQAGQSGKKVEFPAGLAVAKLMLIDSNSGQPSRVGFKIIEGNKQRIAKVSDKAI